MALGREVVDLGWLDLAQQAQQVGRVGHVAVVQEQARRRVVTVAVEVVDSLGVEQRGPALDPVDGVALLQEQLR